MIAVTVHTTGVNWDGVLANVASITVVLLAAGAVVSRSIKRAVKDEIQSVIDLKVTPLLNQIQSQLSNHDTRIAHLEGVEEGKRQALAQARVGPAG